MELCGSYRMAENESRFYLKDWNDHCTTPKKLVSFAERAAAQGIHGYNYALQAAAYLKAGSHSPAETNVFLLLCLPKRYGGYGVKPPLLNPPLLLTDNGYRLIRNGAGGFGVIRRPDLFWSESKLALEYESDMAHSTRERLSEDSKRRGELEKAGIHVLTLTRKQLYNAESFDKIARTIIRLTGGRQRNVTLEQHRNRADLRNEILFEDSFDRIAAIPH